MQSNNYKSYKKGMGILVCIPGDEHNRIQSKRPGIVLSSHPNYIADFSPQVHVGRSPYQNLALEDKKRYESEIQK